MPQVLDKIKEGRAKAKQAKADATPKIDMSEYVKSDIAQANLDKANAERDSAKEVLVSANIIISELSKDIETLREAMRNHGQEAAVLSEERRNIQEAFDNRKAIDTQTIMELQSNLSELMGQLAEARTIVPTHSQHIEPITIPEFKVDSLARGADGKIQSAIIKPMGLN